MAASDTPINGSAYYVEISTDNVTWAKLGNLTNCTLSRGADVRDTTDKFSGGATEIQGGKTNWSLSGEGNTTYSAEAGFVKPNTIHGHWQARQLIYVRFTTANVGDYQYEGQAIVTQYDDSAGTEDNKTYSVTFSGSGVLDDSAVA